MGTETAKDSKTFVAGLVDEMQQLFAQLGEHETLEAESHGRLEVVTLLKLALASEMEASEIAAYWFPSTPEVEAKALLAHQCDDEMKHYQLISRRLEELGEDLTGFDPLAEGHSPLFEYLKGLGTSVERIAAGPFAGEAVARVRNAQFIEFCRSVGDVDTARLYEEVIQPEEVKHHHLGRAFLERHATSAELQELAAAAMHNSLAISDELRSLTEKSTGVSPIPSS